VSPVQVGTGEFRALTPEVGGLRAEVGELREAVEAVRYNPTYVEMCMAMARGQGIEEGQAMVREGRRAARPRRDPARAAHLRMVRDERRSS
jgi:hypothetical protein